MAVALGVAGTLCVGPPAAADADGTSRETPAVLGALPQPRADLTLYLFDVHRRLDPSFGSLAAETSAIFHAMGITLAWRQAGLGTVYGDGGRRELPVIVLDELPGGRPEAVMGLVLKAPNPSAVWIYVEAIKRTLGMAPHDAPHGGAARGLGIAAGRVVAHELIHALAPDLAHTSEGLMRHSLTRADLTSGEWPAYQACAERVRAAFGLTRPSVLLLSASGMPFPPSY
jgi:hypothetical protein